MMLRSPAIAALAVLFIGLAVVVVAVDSTGVDTDVFLPGQPTATPVPPTATPVPEGEASQWLEIAPNQFQYAAAGVQNPATIQIIEVPLADFLENSGLERPPETAPFPLLNLMEQLRDLFQESVAENNLELAPDGISTPAIELIGGVPVTTLRVQIEPQTTPQGTEFPGGDLFFGWLERGEDVVRIEYSYQGPPDAQMFRDLRAWLEENVPELATVTAPADAPEADTEAETPTEPTEDEGEPAAAETEAAEPAAEDAEPTAEATEAPEPVEATEAVEPTAQPDAPGEATEPAAEGADEGEPVPEATEAAVLPEPTPVTMASATGPWREVAPGAFLHSEEPNSEISVAVQNLTDLAVQVDYTPEEGEELTIEGLLSYEEELIRGDLEGFEDLQLDAFEGPTNMRVADVTVSYIEFTVSGEQDGSPVGQITFLGIVPVTGEQVSALRFQYGYQGEANPAIREDFISWLEANAEAITQPVEQAEQPAQTETEQSEQE